MYDAVEFELHVQEPYFTQLRGISISLSLRNKILLPQMTVTDMFKKHTVAFPKMGISASKHLNGLDCLGDK